MTGEFRPPSSTALDHVHTTVRAGLQAIPLAGGAACELFSAVISPPLRKREAEWMNRVGQKLEQLDIDIEQLAAKPQFVDAMLQVAMRNSHEEKLDALRNAVLNSALPTAPDETRQQIFISFIDSFSVWHLRLLKLLDDPYMWYYDNGKDPNIGIGGKLAMTVNHAYPEMQKERELCYHIVSDLHSKRLINADLHADVVGNEPMMRPTKVRTDRPQPRSGKALMASRTTAMGQQFLTYITDPTK
jgi:hypothetical protein